MQGDDLLLWRRRAGYTQGTLAEVLGVSRQTVNAWENGRHAVPDDILARLPAASAPQTASKPSILTYVTAKAWPHLQLYVRLGKHHVRGPHHPEIVLRRDIPRPIDAAVLETGEYKSKINIKTT